MCPDPEVRNVQPDEAGLSLRDVIKSHRDGSETRNVDPSFRGLSTDAEYIDGINVVTRPPRRRNPLRLGPSAKNTPVSSTGRVKQKIALLTTDLPAQKLTPIDHFLIALAQTGNASVACRASMVPRRQVNVMRQTDPEFAFAFQEAMDEAADMLEAEAWRRALEGVAEPFIRSGKPVFDPTTGEAITVRRYSDALLMLLLRGSKPAKYAARPAMFARDDTAQIIKEIAADDDPPRRKTKPDRQRRT